MENLAKVAHDSSGRYDPYIITLAGFNFVDEQCDAYLHELFIIDQDRDKLKAGLNSAGLVTNAILAATPASKTSMAIVAQAFGLSSQFTDTVANSYLYGAHRQQFSASSASSKPPTEIKPPKIRRRSTPSPHRTRAFAGICSFACRRRLRARLTKSWPQVQVLQVRRPLECNRRAPGLPRRRSSSRHKSVPRALGLKQLHVASHPRRRNC